MQDNPKIIYIYTDENQRVPEFAATADVWIPSLNTKSLRFGSEKYKQIWATKREMLIKYIECYDSLYRGNQITAAKFPGIKVLTVHGKIYYVLDYGLYSKINRINMYHSTDTRYLCKDVTKVLATEFEHHLAVDPQKFGTSPITFGDFEF